MEENDVWVANFWAAGFWAEGFWSDDGLELGEGGAADEGGLSLGIGLGL